MEDRILFTLSKAQYALKDHLKREFRKNNLRVSPGQLGILYLLKKRDLQSMGELSRALFIDNSAITRLVDALESQKLVKRMQNREDRRQFLITITGQGIECADRSREIVRVTNDRIKSGFSADEVDAFLRILEGMWGKFHG
ncbi:MAG: MarR family transcriptional regulator [Spirochaetes bacterium]|nr:MarR family transcriptional regulator [Spirochaetota bacterium]